jgi:hypothetical protein
VAISFRSTLATFSVKHTPSGIRITAASSSWSEPFNANENGEPGRNEALRSPNTLAEGCSRTVNLAITGERSASAFFDDDDDDDEDEEEESFSL